MLYAAVEQSPSAELVDPEVLSRYFAKFDEQFFSFADKELTKINTFYSGKFQYVSTFFENLPAFTKFPTIGRYSEVQI